MKKRMTKKERENLLRLLEELLEKVCRAHSLYPHLSDKELIEGLDDLGDTALELAEAAKAVVVQR